MTDLHALLRQYWQFDRFRPLQEEIIRAVLDGHDTLALLPTGGGKSLCFQLPALVRGGVCVVVSPLIALMKDQVAQLRQRGLRAEAIYSGLSHRGIDIALDNAVNGGTQFLYVSPERLQTELFLARLARMTVGLLAVDEAHCISQWGYDFRPPYLQIADLRPLLPDVPVIALTATATPAVRDDICEKLCFRQPKIFQQSFARANLAYAVRETEDKEGQLLRVLRGVPGTSVVYVRSRRRTETVAAFLRRQGIGAAHYHAGLTPELRSRTQDDWVAGRTRVVVATNAFGMGIDKPDVRTVVHLEPPDTLEAYYQEAGRAGRDEQKAYAVLLYHPDDLAQLEKRVAQAYPPPEQLRRVYQALANACQLAVGSGQFTSFDFDLDDFQRTFQLPPLDTYYALRQLERLGLIQFDEQFFSPSRAYITVDQKTLYAFQVANAGLDPLIKTMLRLYGGGLFAQFVRISEAELANALQSTPAQVRTGLQYLHQQEILTYEPRKDKPQLTFVTDRHATDRLPLQEAQMAQRRARDLARVTAVAHYAHHRQQCRTTLLLAYFGETAAAPCGVCDVCLARKRTAALTPEEGQRLEELLTLQAHTPQELVAALPGTASYAVLDYVRQSVAEGRFCYDAAGKLTKPA